MLSWENDLRALQSNLELREQRVCAKETGLTEFLCPFNDSTLQTSFQKPASTTAYVTTPKSNTSQHSLSDGSTVMLAGDSPLQTDDTMNLNSPANHSHPVALSLATASPHPFSVYSRQHSHVDDSNNSMNSSANHSVISLSSLVQLQHAAELLSPAAGNPHRNESFMSPVSTM